jgi:hypothetical protein
VDKNTGMPSFGFYTLTDKLKLTNGLSEAKKKDYLHKEQTKLFALYA